MQNTSTNINLVQLEAQTYDVSVSNVTNTSLVPAAITVTKFQALPINTAFVLGVGELTSSGTTATVTHTAHGFLDGQKVVILGATQSEYNGTYVVTVTGANTFTYKFAGSATTPATTTTSIVAALNSPLGLQGKLQLTFTAGHVKRWLRANMVINVTGFGTTVALNGKYLVASVDYTGNTATLYAKTIQDFSQYNTLTTEAATATISVHAQRVIFRNGGANAITVSPNIQALGTSGYQYSIAAGAEKEFIAPSGAKFDMADWAGIAATATTTLSVLVF